MGIIDNSFNNSGEGEQNIGQGDGAIGKQENIKQDVRGNRNIVLGTGDAYVEQHYHDAPPSVIPRNLQPLDDCFLGRDKELAELLEQLQPGRIAAVCGPGGMGKSALAVQAVSRLEANRFPDGIVFHSFYGHPKTEEALQEIIKTFGEKPEPPLDTTLRRILSGRKTLLILDGAEEADDLKGVLVLRSTCGVLITSRKRDDAQGFRLDLKPLEEQPAAAVFCEHSGATANDEAVQGICAILDGWPVGLRIAGRYLNSTGERAAEYLKWLEQEPFKELGDGEHQEENAALLLRRSVAQVSDDARLALGVAGTLAFAPIAREPVAAILEDDERRARKALGELVNYSLLEKREERWQVSHALVHTYARKELRLSKESLERLAGWYMAFCYLASEEGVQGYTRLDGERVHSLRLIESCFESGLWKKVQVLAGAIDTYLDRQGWWTEETAILKLRLTAARQAGDRRDEQWSLNSLGYLCERRDETNEALAWYKQCLPIACELGDQQEKGVILNNIAEIYRQQDVYDQALQYFEQSLSIRQEIGDGEGEGESLNNIGRLYFDQGDYKQALQYYELSLSICKKIGYTRGKGASLNNIAEVYRIQGKPAEALECQQKALRIVQKQGDRANEAATYGNIGRTYYDIGDLAKAEEYISRAVEIAEQIGHPYLEVWHKALACVRAKRQGE